MADWIEIGIKMNSEAQEAAIEILYTHGTQGVWLIEDGESVTIKTYLTEQDISPENLAIIKNEIQRLEQFGLNPGDVQLITDKVNDQDWANSWKEYFYPEKISETFVVKPTWREYKAGPNEKVIEIDPGMAFGTGTHASTFLALQALEEVGPKQPNMLDVGTGSGILSIAGALLGIPRITAVDIDSVAVQVATENVMLNKVQKQVQVMRSDLVERVKEKNQKYKLVVANILAEIILLLLPDLPDVLETDGYFIASGIITERFENVRNALEEQGLHLIRIFREGEWVALIAKKQ